MPLRIVVPLAVLLLTACGEASHWSFKKVADRGEPFYLLRTEDINDISGTQPRNIQFICNPKDETIQLWINTGPLQGNASQTFFSAFIAFDDEKPSLRSLEGVTRRQPYNAFPSPYRYPETALHLPIRDILKAVNSQLLTVDFMSENGQVRSVFKTAGLRQAIAENFNGACTPPPANPS